MNVANRFSGGFATLDFQNQGFRVYANADGGFGVGDVLISTNCTLHISAGLTDTIDDASALYLEGPKDSRRDSKVVIDSHESVAYYYLDGVKQAEGTYGGFGSTADNIDAVTFTGTNILTVIGPPLGPHTWFIVR